MRPLSITAFAATVLLAAGQHFERAIAATSPIPPVRMETTPRADSAPLNFVDRSFRAIEPFFEETAQSQRLSYRIHHARPENEPIETSLKRLLVNIGGGLVHELVAGGDENRSHALLADFTSDIRRSISASGRAPELSAVPLGKFQAATHALAARSDVKVFSADVVDEGFESRVLILQDEETSELLLLYVSPGSHEP